MNLSLGGDLHGFAPLYRGFTWTGLTRSEATLQPGKVGGGYHKTTFSIIFNSFKIREWMCSIGTMKESTHFF